MLSVIFFAFLTRPFAAINADSVKHFTDGTATLTSQTWFIYIQQCNAMQYTKNTTQQKLFNIIKTSFGADFLVYCLMHNVTLPQCIRKAVYYTKKLSGHFPSVIIFVRPWWKENNVV